jgi:quercetin dioxygenase-like cupin family protein
MFIYIPPQERHGYRNTGRTPLVLLCMIPLLS